jgi:hypothetical protein
LDASLDVVVVQFSKRWRTLAQLEMKMLVDIQMMIILVQRVDLDPGPIKIYLMRRPPWNIREGNLKRGKGEVVAGWASQAH